MFAYKGIKSHKKFANPSTLWTSFPPVSSEGERERERVNGKEKGCEAIEEFKRRGGRDVEPYL